MTKILRIGSAAVAAAGVIVATGAFASLPAARTQTARSTSLSGTASTGQVRPGQPMIPAGAPGQERTASTSGVAAATKSVNWAGYATTRGGKTFRLVTATFFVPYLNCAATRGTPTYSAHWVGFDGFFGKPDSVEQDGIEADCLGSAGTTPRYRAWYEMFPKPEIVSSIKVNPGDSITATVSYSPTTRKFRLTVRDNTNRHRFSVARACAARSCPRTSTEAISEAPSNNKGELLPLADYGSVAFSNIAITDGAAQRGGLTSRHWGTTKIIQIGAGSGKRIGVPTAIHASGFANYWLGPI